MDGKKSKPLDIEFSVKREGAPSESDLALWAALDEAGLDFSPGDKGNAYVTVIGLGGYPKRVRIASKTERVRGQQLRSISCKVSSKLPDSEHMIFCLQNNGVKNLGKWSLEIDEKERTGRLLFEANVDANLEPQFLKKAVLAVGEAAHQFEGYKAGRSCQKLSSEKAGQGTVATREVDARVPTALDLAGLRYNVGKNGEVAVLLGADQSGNRSQVVYVNSTTVEFHTQELRAIYSPVYFGDMPEWKVLAYCLKENAERKLGKWSLQVNEEKGTLELFFETDVDANLSSSQLGTIVLEVGREADVLQAKVSE